MTSRSDPALDRLLHGSPLRRKRTCIAIGVVLLVLLAIAAYMQFRLLGRLRPDIARVFFTALGASTFLSFVPLAILWFLDRRERETPWLFAAAFVWGALIATGLALPLNTAFTQAVDVWLRDQPALREVLGPGAATMIAAPISAPIVEELAKALGVLALFWLLRAEFDNMRDGLVYGALVGLGFTWFEAPLYVAQGYAQHGVAPWGMQLGWRYALFGFGGHAMFTGIFGALLGLALQTRRRWLKLLAPLVGLALAIAAHFLNNVLPLLFAVAGARRAETPPRPSGAPPEVGFVEAFVLGSVVDLTLFLPFAVVMGLALWRSGVWERRVIRDELAEEVGPTVTDDEYAAILADRMFRTRRIDRVHSRASAALVNAQHELAFRKRRVRDEGGDPDADPLVAGWRTEIANLRWWSARRSART